MSVGLLDVDVVEDTIVMGRILADKEADNVGRILTLTEDRDEGPT